MEIVNHDFWKKKRVFITGITGFKGSWLAIWLQKLGADIYGYSLPCETDPSCFRVCGLDYKIPWMMGDILDNYRLASVMRDFQPEIVFHLAAQPLVRRSYRNPLETFNINVLGTASVLEAIRYTVSVKCAVIVTSDKVYENKTYTNIHKETDRLGGRDPYSASKACAELVVEAYRNSFFNDSTVAVATARAGNVIGGGDWSEDRIIPDAVRAIQRKDALSVRNPRSVRPWQHVIDPLGGYMLLAECLFTNKLYVGAWNFGPYEPLEIPVSDLLAQFFKKWGKGSWRPEKSLQNPYESPQLNLDCSLAYTKLKWYQRISTDEMIDLTVEWYKKHLEGANMLEITHKQLDQFSTLD